MSGTDRDLAQETHTNAVPVEFVLAPQPPEAPAGDSHFFDDLLVEEKFSTQKNVVAEVASAGFDYLAFCEKQIRPGFATIPDKFKAGDPRNKYFSEVAGTHGLTGLSILNEKVRGRVALAMSKCTERGEGFALLLTDANQLKRLNDIAGRPFGDIGILSNAAELIRLLEEGGFGDDMYVFAAGESPDEVIVFVRNLDAEKEKKLQELIKQRNKIQHKIQGIEVKDQLGATTHQEAVFSGSAAVVTSFDPVVAAEVAAFRNIIKQRRGEGAPVTPAYTLFDILREEADGRAHEVKQIFERDTFPDVAEFRDLTPEEARSLLLGEYAGKRISPALFDALTALAILKGMSDSEKMPPDERVAAIQQLEEAVARFIQE